MRNRIHRPPPPAESECARVCRRASSSPAPVGATTAGYIPPHATLSNTASVVLPAAPTSPLPVPVPFAGLRLGELVMSRGRLVTVSVLPSGDSGLVRVSRAEQVERRLQQGASLAGQVQPVRLTEAVPGAGHEQHQQDLRYRVLPGEGGGGSASGT